MKRIISILLAVMMVFGVFSSVTSVASAATTGCYIIPYDTQYFPKYTGDSDSFRVALAELYIDTSLTYRKSIASVNGIDMYEGTIEQDTPLFDLLKNGTLINPDWNDGIMIPTLPEPTSATNNNVCFPKYTGTSGSIVTALNSLGIDSSKAHRMEIAKANGITDYEYTPEQNTQMLNLLKEGKLIKPTCCESDGFIDPVPTATQSTEATEATSSTSSEQSDIYYPKYTGDSGSITTALNAIGVDSSKENRIKIAFANGIVDYAFTPDQNLQMLNLLKAGKLIKAGVVIEKEAELEEDFMAFVYNINSWNLLTRANDRNAVCSKRTSDGAQLLNFLRTEDGTYNIICNTMYLTVVGDSIAPTSNVKFDQYTGEYNQKWTIIGEDGRYKIKPYVNDYIYLEVKDNSTEDGANIQINNHSIGDEQYFQIIPYLGNKLENGYTNGYKGGAPGDGKVYAKGIDVSKWNERDGDYNDIDFDFHKVKADGNDFVIIRAGSTYKGEDPMFDKYYDAAKAAGLDVGAYFFSYGVDEKTMKSDAKQFLDIIKGKKFEYPLYLDFEDPSQDALDSIKSKSLCLTFMTMMANEGYLTGIYTGTYMLGGMELDSICATYEAWIARYYDSDGSTLSPEFSKKYGIYQYTSSYKIEGIEGNVDANYCYKNYPAIVKYYGFNGYEKTGSCESLGGHTEIIEKAVAPTCDEDGLTEGKHCSVCYEVMAAQEKIPATGHVQVTVYGKEPTCSELGLTDGCMCIKCNKIFVEQTEIAKLPHTEVVDKAVAPSCIETGLTEGKHCSVCNEILVAQTELAKTNHKEPENWTILKDPTCTKDGAQIKSCTECDAVIKSQSIKSTGKHIVKTVGNKKATYFAKGYSGNEVCKDCGKIVLRGKSIARVKLKTPIVTVKGGKNKFTVRYKKVVGATGFQIKYKKGKRTVIETYTAKKSVNRTIRKISKGNYKVQIRAFVKQGSRKVYSNWTKGKKVKIIS